MNHPKYNATRQLEVAKNLEALWTGLLPDHQVPSRSQFLQWSAMAPETTVVSAINRAARKALRERFDADRIGRYVTGILRCERDGTSATSAKGKSMSDHNDASTPTDQLIDAAKAAEPSDLRDLAIHLLESGQLTADSSLADLAAALGHQHSARQ